MKCSRETENRIRKIVNTILLVIVVIAVVVALAFSIYYAFDVVVSIAVGVVALFSCLFLGFWLTGDINICSDD